MRELETMALGTPTNAEAELAKLLSISPEELIKLCEEDPNVLTSMMDIALVPDNAFLPCILPNSSHLLAAFAINTSL